MTDLVESTRLEARIGPVAADELREEHFSLLRAAIAATGGHEVKTVGDGLMVEFRNAASAVRCAVLIQQHVERRNRDSAEPLRIRVGIGLGDATRQDGDLFGPPVIEAVRLCDKASGGQILATEPVQLVGGRDGYTFRALDNPPELKGLSRPVRVYEIQWQPAGDWKSALPVPARLRAAVTARYVPREAQHQHIAELWSATGSGTRRAVFIEGEAGIGKTRFIGQVACDLRAAGALVLFGQCAEDLDAPYGAFIDALQPLVTHLPDAMLEQHLERHRGELSRLLPDLTRRMPSAPPPRHSDPESERYLLFAAVVGLLQQVCAQTPVALFFDDLHWADRPTLVLLKHLIAETHGCRLLVIATFRDTDVTRDHGLAQLLADLRREDGITRVKLNGLSKEDIVALMELAAGHALDASGRALAGKLTAETDGNPFFVGELLRHLTESGAVRRGADEHWQLVGGLDELGLPQSVHEVIERRIDRLGSDMRRILQTAAVVGRDFELDVLARVLGKGNDQDTLLDALEAAVAAGIVQERDEGSWTFAHNLINHTLYDALSLTRQSRLHRRVAEALEDVYGEDTGPRVAELARHWNAAAAPVEERKALHYSRRAGEQALERLAPDEAVRFFSQALELLRRIGDDLADKCDLSIRLGEAQRQAGRPEFRKTLLDASRMAAELRDADRAARAALANNRGFASKFGKVDQARLKAVERALELDSGADAARCARLRALQAMELQFDANHTRRRDLADQALELARQSGDRGILPYVLRDRFHAIWSVDTVEARCGIAKEMRELSEESGDPLEIIWALDRSVHAAVESGQLRDALAYSRRLLASTDQLGQPGLRWHALYYHAGLMHLAGDLAEAERLADAAKAEAELAGELDDGKIVWTTQIGGIRVEQRRAEEVAGEFEQAFADYPTLPGFEAGLAVTLCDLGLRSEAAALVDRATERGFQDVPCDQTWSTTVAMWARAAAGVDSARAAAPLYSLLQPWNGRVVWNGASGFGVVDAYLGMLASTLGAMDRAQGHFAATSALDRREGMPGWEARNLAHSARAHLRTGDAARARAVAGEALELARRHQWNSAAAEAEAVLRESVYEEVR